MKNKNSQRNKSSWKLLLDWILPAHRQHRRQRLRINHRLAQYLQGKRLHHCPLSWRGLLVQLRDDCSDFYRAAVIKLHREIQSLAGHLQSSREFRLALLHFAERARLPVQRYFAELVERFLGGERSLVALRDNLGERSRRSARRVAHVRRKSQRLSRRFASHRYRRRRNLSPLGA